MKLDDFIAVSGLPGLYRLKTNRPNGLLLEDLDTGRIKFASVRKHQFTPLESVGLYTMSDTINLQDVFKLMHDRSESLSIPEKNASKEVIKSYFEELIPEYDPDRVFVKDMKKVIRWYNLLKDHNVFETTDEEE